MKKIIAGSLAASLLIGFSMNGEVAAEQKTVSVKQKTVSTKQINQAKALPVFRGSYAGTPMKGRFDEDGFAIWYMDAKDFVKDGTHLSLISLGMSMAQSLQVRQISTPDVSTTVTSSATMRQCISR
ncbi:hypothetical protein Exig_2646 [Exiguobacterium sibiricum 255-15]|uniref:Uncharacterized protein n=1 Tax=Exiguobacterium sibiricum (strain DSM 17290 / CCUG 55495 / CIP 109462 / JCM 13490 / 255-15) TaxID=262543 RepID=B1YMN4_EXIS2|nr:hypothetical protein [Exiguobacterium sibiricum]ACB62094.1 hypothetical protein Exig_2646 [Exiguobacterium sibiricum 255-15]